MKLTVPLPDDIFSIDIVPSELLAPGEMILFGRAVYAHPLDVIATRFSGDALGRLDAAMQWLLDNAMRRLSTLERGLRD